MFPVNKILCPIDFSEHSLEALDNAVEMAQNLSSELVLTHIISPIPVRPTPTQPSEFDVSGYRDTLEENSEENMDSVIKKHIPDNVKVKKVIRSGMPAQEIDDIAEEENIDLLIISTHGRTGLSHVIFGSVAEKIIRHAPCPVLTIRSKT